MSKETITQKQGIAIMVTFILGSTLVLGSSGEAKQDIWIAQLIAVIIAVPIFFIYARLLSIFPGMSLYDILEHLFGKVLGKIFALPFIWFAFHLGSLVIRNFSEFINIISLPETPQCIIALCKILLCIWAVKAGIEVIGRWTSIVFPIIIIFIMVITILLVPMYKFENLKPLLYEGFKPILGSTFSVIAFPLAETVVFTTLLNNLRNKDSSYKVYYWSLLISGATIILISIRSIITLGIENISILYFSTYASVRLINIGEFLQRIEIMDTIIFIFAGFVKISICLYAASNGLAKVLKLHDYRQIVAPVGLLMMLLSSIIYINVIEMFEWAEKYYKYYALPIEVILPLVILICAEIKIRLIKNKASVQK